MSKKKIDEVVNRLLVSVGNREFDGKLYLTYICKGNLIEELETLLEEEKRDAVRKFADYCWEQDIVYGSPSNEIIDDFLSSQVKEDK